MTCACDIHRFKENIVKTGTGGIQIHNLFPFKHNTRFLGVKSAWGNSRADNSIRTHNRSGIIVFYRPQILTVSLV